MYLIGGKAYELAPLAFPIEDTDFELGYAERRATVRHTLECLARQRSGFPREKLVLIHGSDAEVVCFACGARATLRSLVWFAPSLATLRGGASR